MPLKPLDTEAAPSFSSNSTSINTHSTSLPALPTTDPAVAPTIPSITLTRPYQVLTNSNPSLTSVGGKKEKRATIQDPPAPLPQLDGEEGKVVEEVEMVEEGGVPPVGPQPPTWAELACPSVAHIGCGVCGEKMFWTKTEPKWEFWDHTFMCKKKCEPVLLQTE